MNDSTLVDSPSRNTFFSSFGMKVSFESADNLLDEVHRRIFYHIFGQRVVVILPIREKAEYGIILAVPLKEESAGAAGAAAGEEAQGGSIVRELNRASSYFV